MNTFTPDVSVIAGVGPGLGASLARKFAKEGCRLAVLARSPDFLEALSKELREHGTEVLAIPADIGETDQVAAGFARIRDELGPVDLLVNNASASGPFTQPFVEITPESFTHGWMVGVRGAFLCSQAVVPDMLRKNTGCVLFTGATSSVRGSAITFSSAKFALRGFAQALARELWPKGIHVAHIVIDGAIRESEHEPGPANQTTEPLMNPAAIAEAYWGLVKQDRSAWSLELDLRPYRENFFE
ncbi:MAG TPA: SDR family NAD(P)-dependent oxidoreductase [Chthoniobacterales bacterium]|nr:SDR family NAD(P)-dependent oxidoreductase [Chthoniobacterales bacterium]